MIHRPDSATWDLVAENYSVDFDAFNLDLGQELVGLFTSLGVDPKRPIAELGSGSGHLSGLLAKAGFNVTLMDFSQASLDKAQTLFQRHGLEGTFLNRDLMALDGSERFQLTWNSGVMEHFDDASLLEAFQAIHRATDSHFVFLVPNPESLPYLLYRAAKAANGSWDVGEEFLRLTYDRYLAWSGFEIQETRYLGWGITKNFFDYFLGDRSREAVFSKLVDEGYVHERNAYLKAYVCRKVAGAVPAIPEPRPEDPTLATTFRFDEMAKALPPVGRRRKAGLLDRLRGR